MSGDERTARRVGPEAGATRSGAAMAPGIRPVPRALQDAAPLILGYLPYGLVLGVMINTSRVSDLAGWAMSPLVFAGAAQIAMVELLDKGAAAVIVIAAALVINLRHVMYSGAMVPWFRDAPTWQRYMAPFFLADPVYALSATRFPDFVSHRHRWLYYMTLGITLWVGWQSLTALGLLVAAQLPSMSLLEIAVPLVFVGLLVPMLSDRPTIAAAVVGGGATLVAQNLPLHLGLIVGAISGVAAGVLLDPEVRR